MLAEKLAALAPGDLDHVFYSTGGSSAVDSALRFVQFFNNFLGNFFGWLFKQFVNRFFVKCREYFTYVE